MCSVTSVRGPARSSGNLFVTRPVGERPEQRPRFLIQRLSSRFTRPSQLMFPSRFFSFLTAVHRDSRAVNLNPADELAVFPVAPDVRGLDSQLDFRRST